MLTDTHCHLNMMVKKTFDVKLTSEEINAAQELIIQAEQLKVNKIINVGTSLIESQNSIALARRYPTVFASVGIHPTDASQEWRSELEIIKAMLQEKKQNKIVGIGECGMDFYHPNFKVERQRAAFKAQIELAIEHDLALIVHSRDAGLETLSCLREYQGRGLRGTIHCFSYDEAFALEAIDLGFVLGIDGPVTYPKNDLLRSVVKKVGLENIILETDSPFLPPQIIRGKQNHPKYLEHIAQYIAKLLDTDLESVAQITEENVKRIFGI